MHDKIILHDCLFITHIGITEVEREKPRALFLDMELFVDIYGAALADHIEKTISYTHVHDHVQTHIASRSWNLIETIAHEVAELILRDFSVFGVLVRVRKPSGLSDRSVAYTAVEICRYRS